MSNVNVHNCNAKTSLTRIKGKQNPNVDTQSM